MAKRKRAKKKAAPKKAAVKKKKKAKVAGATDALKAPNHNTPLDIHDLNELDYVEDSHRFAVLRLMLSENSCALPETMAFVDKAYGMRSWVDRAAGTAPTWMDPEIFIRMCNTDRKLAELGAKAIKSNTAAVHKAVIARFEELLEEKYIPYLKQQFKKAVPVLAEWMIAHFSDQLKNPSSLNNWRAYKGIKVKKTRKKKVVA